MLSKRWAECRPSLEGDETNVSPADTRETCRPSAGATEKIRPGWQGYCCTLPEDVEKNHLFKNIFNTIK